METNAWLRALIILLVIIAAAYLLGQVWSLAMQFGDVITLFFLAWLVAFLLNPIVRLLCRSCRIARPAAAALVYLAVMAAIVVIGALATPVIVAQLAQLARAIPTYTAMLPDWLTAAQDELIRRGVSVDLHTVYKTESLVAQVQQVGTLLVQNALTIATGFASFIFNVLIVLMLSFYFTLDGPRMAEQAVRLAPRDRRPEVHYLFDSIERSFGGFVRGTVVLALLCAALTGAVMWVAGLGYVLVVSLYVVVVMLIPFFGPFLALIPPAVIAAIQLPMPNYLIVVVVLVALQSAVLNVLSPKIMGDALGIHPLLVFLAILVGAKVAGVAGAIFGVPIAGVINAMATFLYRRAMNLPAHPERRRQRPPEATDTQTDRLRT